MYIFSILNVLLSSNARIFVKVLDIYNKKFYYINEINLRGNENVLITYSCRGGLSLG